MKITSNSVNRNAKRSFAMGVAESNTAEATQAQQSTAFKTGAEVKAHYQSALAGNRITLGGSLPIQGVFTTGNVYEGTADLGTIKESKNFNAGQPNRLTIMINMVDNTGAKVQNRYKIRESFWNDLDKINADTPLKFTINDIATTDAAGRVSNIQFLEY